MTLPAGDDRVVADARVAAPVGQHTTNCCASQYNMPLSTPSDIKALSLQSQHTSRLGYAIIGPASWSSQRERQEAAMHIVGTHHIALYTANFERVRDFYVEILRCPVVGEFVGHRIVFLAVGTTTIELIAHTAAPPIPESQGWNHLAFEVSDLDAAYAELCAKQVPFHSPPEYFPADRPAVRIAFFK